METILDGIGGVMVVKEIIEEYLKANGYGGLVDNDACGCFDDDLFPCEGPCQGCVPAYKVKAHCDDCESRSECDNAEFGVEYCLTTKKPECKHEETENIGGFIIEQIACKKCGMIVDII